MTTYIIKVSWRATSKMLKIEAKSESDAIEKACKRKDVYGYWDMRVVGIR